MNPSDGFKRQDEYSNSTFGGPSKRQRLDEDSINRKPTAQPPNFQIRGGGTPGYDFKTLLDPKSRLQPQKQSRHDDEYAESTGNMLLNLHSVSVRQAPLKGKRPVDVRQDAAFQAGTNETWKAASRGAGSSMLSIPKAPEQANLVVGQNSFPGSLNNGQQEERFRQHVHNTGSNTASKKPVVDLTLGMLETMIIQEFQLHLLILYL